MLKMFHQVSAAGGSTEFWEQNWVEGDFTESARFCEVDPLRPIFDRHVRPGSVMLEGGCGRGLYVAHHAARGVRAIGLDFATRTLADVKRAYPSLLLGAADVAKLPLRDDTIDTYYSGGVVEHFEAGPHQAIAEAARVLRDDGTLLISVPYFSPLRRMLAPFHRREWRVTGRHAAESPPAQRAFFQYAYKPREFEAILAEHGLSVRRRQGYSILWGLYELPLLGRVLNRAAQGRTEGAPADAVAVGTGPSSEDAPPGTQQSLAKRLVVSEDDSIRFAGSMVRLLRWFAANMMMYECGLTGSRP